MVFNHVAEKKRLGQIWSEALSKLESLLNVLVGSTSCLNRCASHTWKRTYAGMH